MTHPVALLVAVAQNGVIGRDNRLLWHLKTDLRRFKALTTGKPLVIGRRTHESIGRLLPGRETIILSRDPAYAVAGAHVVAGIEPALALGDRLATESGAGEVIVGGGGDVYRLALPRADRIYMTRVSLTPKGDATFPELDPSQWRETARQAHAAGPDDEAPFTFIDYIRRT